MSATDWRVRFKDSFGRTTGDWINFPTEVRARTFASQSLLNDPSIWGVEITIKPKGATDEHA
jgi:hypothetical protein